MKQLKLLVIGLVVLLSSCTAYRAGQTPDDVYYSPGVTRGGEETVRKQRGREEQEYQEYISSHNAGSKMLVSDIGFRPYLSRPFASSSPPKAPGIHFASRPFSLSIPSAFHCLFLLCHFAPFVSNTENGGSINRSRNKTSFSIGFPNKSTSAKFVSGAGSNCVPR